MLHQRILGGVQIGGAAPPGQQSTFVAAVRAGKMAKTNADRIRMKINTHKFYWKWKIWLLG